MPVRKLHALTAIPCSLVLAAARQRDALLRARGAEFREGCLLATGLKTRFGTGLRVGFGQHRLPSLAILSAVAGLSGVSLAGGCVAVGGARNVEAPTLGKQLVDLKAALDAGVITEAEYAAAKSRMLAGDK